MDNVRMPIKTTRDGDKITKICTEDIYKIINRVQDYMDKAHNNSIDIINDIHKIYDGYEGELIIGTGTSQPCKEDVFNEEIGNNIAFMKAKLNANIKKYNFLRKVYNEYIDLITSLGGELGKVMYYIDYDLAGIRKYNPEYLKGFEYKYGML